MLEKQFDTSMTRFLTGKGGKATHQQTVSAFCLHRDLFANLARMAKEGLIVKLKNHYRLVRTPTLDEVEAVKAQMREV